MSGLFFYFPDKSIYIIMKHILCSKPFRIKLIYSLVYILLVLFLTLNGLTEDKDLIVKLNRESVS